MERYVAFTVVAALVFAIGGAMQKEGLARRTGPLSFSGLLRQPKPVLVQLWHSPIWIVGSLLTAVGFLCEAQALGLRGSARNLPDGRVEVIACGDETALNALEQWLWEGPRAAHVTEVSVSHLSEEETADLIEYLKSL